METISTDWITLAGIVGILAFLWKLSREIADLRERMARLEGRMLGVEQQIVMLGGVLGQRQKAS